MRIMKRNIYIWFWACLACFVTSCIEDESTYGVDTLRITINGIEDSYDKVSFADEVLTISPVVTSSFDTSDLTYKWTFYDPNKVVGTSVYRAEMITETKDLSLPVNMADGSYVFAFTVSSKSTGYSQTVETNVHIASALSKGFVFFKENGEGNSDYDMLNIDNQKMLTDVLISNTGAAIPGKPRCLDVIYCLPYMDTQNDTKASANSICITTENNEVRWLRAMDCLTLKDASDCRYEQAVGEIPYRSFHGYFDIYYLTNNGVCKVYDGSASSSVGYFGANMGGCSSTHATHTLANRYNILYWNGRTHSIQCIGPNNVERNFTNTAKAQLTNLNYDCLKIGICKADGTIGFYLLQNNNDGSRVMYMVNQVAAAPELARVVTIDANSHMAKANLFAVNGQQSTIAYCVDNNKVYTYDLKQNNPEKLLTFNGLPDNETITYISNRFYNDPSAAETFDYLIVGTQVGTTYKVYFYNMIGGEPSGNPVHVVTGSGVLKSVNYIGVSGTQRYATNSLLSVVLDE